MTLYVGGNPKISKGIQNLDEELERNSDRAVGILAGSIVETRLTTFLKDTTQHYGKMWESRTHSEALATLLVPQEIRDVVDPRGVRAVGLEHFLGRFRRCRACTNNASRVTEQRTVRAPSSEFG